MSGTTTEGVSRYDAFISYSRKDTEFARLLEKALEGYTPPRSMQVRQRHLNIFRDEADFTGVEYHAAVQAHLVNSAKLLVICSPHARASQYVDEEIHLFAQAHEFSNIIPVLISGVPNNEPHTSQGDLAFPNTLCELIAMPLAVDYRTFDHRKHKISKGAFYAPWHSLLANIYGVSRDEIELRERKRQTRARTIRVAIVGVIFVSLSTALVITLISRNEAVEQRNIATSRQLAAQSRLTRNERSWWLERSSLLAIEAVRHAPLLESDLEVRRCLRLLPTRISRFRHPGLVRALAFSPDGGLVATAAGRTFGVGDIDNTARVWDVRTGKQVAVFEHGGYVAAIAFSPGGDALVTASSDKRARIFQLPPGNTVHELPHGDTVTGVAFSPDGTRVASASADGMARLWDAKTGMSLNELRHPARVLDAVFSLDGSYLATADYDGTARVWEVRSGKEISKIACQREIYSIAFGGKHEENLGAVGSEDWTARVFDIAGETKFDPIPHTNGVYEVVLTPGRVATRSGDNVVRLFDTGSGREHARYVHQGEVSALAVSAGGRYLASGSADRTARIWDLQTDQEVTRIVHDDGVTGVAFSADGKHVATASGGSVSVWNTVTGPGLATFASSLITSDSFLSEPLSAIAFGADGQLLAGGSPIGAPHRFDCQGNEAENLSAEVSRDSGRYEIHFDNASVSVLDKKTKQAARLTRPEGVSRAAVSPNGRFVALAGDGTTVRVFTLPTGEEIAQLEHQASFLGDSPVSMVFSPDSRFLVTAIRDLLFVHPLRPDDLVAEACSRLSRNLDFDEWRQHFGPAEPYRKTCHTLPPWGAIPDA